MSHTYTPSPVPIVNTTLPDDGDLATAVSVNTPFEDALDGVKYAQDSIGGVSLGTMLPADLDVATGSLVANGSGVTVGNPLTVVGALTCNSTSTLTGAVTCSSTLHSVGAFTCANNITATGSLNGASLSIPGNISAIGGTTTIGGTACTISSTTCTVSNLVATVSTASGITYTSAGRAHYRTRQITDGELASGVFILAPTVSDIFYVTSLTALRATKLNDSGSTNGDVIELSTYGMTGGFGLEVYTEDELTLLVTMTATTNSNVRVVKVAAGCRILSVSDG